MATTSTDMTAARPTRDDDSRSDGRGPAADAVAPAADAAALTSSTGAVAAAPAADVGRRGAMTLNALPHDTAARVVSVEGAGAVSLRLMEMGVVPGAPIRVIKAAPLGDPIEVRVHGYHLALRRSEAETILVTSDR